MIRAVSTAHDSSRPPSPADLGELSPSAAAERVAAAVAAAAPSRERDAAILALLVDRRLGDPLLPHLPLASLDLLTARCLERLARSPAQEAGEDRRLAWTLLDVLRRSSLLRRFRDENLIDPWSERILALVDASHFTFPQLFAQRAAGYGERPLFQVPTAGGTRTVSWRQAAGRVELIARSLLAVSAQTGGRPIAVVARNCLEMALVDLACLSSGIVNVMVPATSTEAEVGYILGHAGVGAVVVSDPELLPRVLAARERLPALGPIIGIDKLGAATRHVLPFDHLLARSSEVTAAELAERGRRLRIDDLATVMYTSGTTGTPKGIRFSHRNIVFKRFARALALPEIGEDDRFLCYLPLFHTFGRFLEMTGCVFWGATYCFARDPSIETLTRQMREHAATVLISIPMKWMQLYEAVRQNVDIEAAPDDEVRAAVRRLVGHGLRWGLSAAGYLDPEIFRFMQRHGIELMSGFGMTEATGGITMTPPGRYREDSLGPALPGIDLGIADDGELLIRGPYVMQGYLEPPDGSPSFDAAGWFHTGDLMERDRDGFIRIIDRKKEIYKNINGQTIAPQKIENLFRDFESVARVFLVGDHREFNTALIYPNFGFAELDLKGLAPHDLKGHFRSLVVSANSFLAPFERIVDFAVIERDFDAALGELTPKGTYRRKVIERSFAEEIRLLYRRRTLVVGGASVAVPNWLFQALGITSQELQVRGDSLELASHGTTIGIRRLEDGGVEIGSACYRAMRPVIDLGHLLATPQLWLGNDELVGFAPLTEAHRDRRRLHEVSAQWLRRTRAHTATAQEREAVSQLLRRQEAELADLHLAALLLASEEPEDGVAAVKALDHLLRVNGGERTDEVLRVLRRAVDSPSLPARRRALQVLAGSEIEGRFRSTLAAFLGSGEEVLDADTISVLAERDLRADRIDAFMDEAEARCTAAGERLDPALPSLCDFLSAYGAAHPSQYRRLRGFFTRALMVAHSDEARGLADEGKRRLAQGFRIWLGSPSRVAVDPETGLEYRWEDVVEFSDEVDAATRSRILNALRATPVIREASFLFGASPRALHLDDILPGGIWIRHLGTSHGKSVYRMTVRTRGQEQLELALNLNRELSSEAAQEEINWLIVCSEARALGPLVEIFGGWWPEQQLWTEEFIPGETLDRALLRLARQQEAPDRLRGWWPFAAWAALGAYVDFWNRTGRRLIVADPSPANVIVPLHDYLSGARLVSIASRAPFGSVLEMFASFRQVFIEPVERAHPELAGLADWDIVFSAFLEIVGAAEGAAMLGEVLARAWADGAEAAAPLQSFLAAVERRGFLPRRLFFAAKRYRRWERLNPDAALSARARTLHEMFVTYGLAELRSSYPEARTRFFRETVFRAAASPLAEGLDALIARLHSRELAAEELSAAVADLRAHLDPGTADDFFLARLSYPHLRPDDEVEYVAAAAGGSHQSEMVVTCEDGDGNSYQIRHALSPKEVGRLHQLFLTAKLAVQFRPEHRFLVAVNDRGALIGGLFYEEQAEALSAHMEKVVVAHRFQGRGVARALIDELRNRLRSAGYRSLSTGFFRPQFFYRMGFTVERGYAGLVSSLAEADDPV